jgi:DNA-binding response OmpR family regulator
MRNVPPGLRTCAPCPPSPKATADRSNFGISSFSLAHTYGILAHHAGKVLAHRFLLEKVWGPPYVEETHYLRVYMANLRRKLEADPARPRYLLTEQGVGYRLADE